MGIIQDLIPSSDGKVRAATVKTTIPNKKLPLHRTLNTTIRTKAICHLYPLELDIELEDVEENNEVENDTIEILSNSQWTICASNNCSRPSGVTLKWIQCESCEDWLHTHRMGLDNNKEIEENFFACLKCWKPKLPQLLEEEEEEEMELDFSGFITEVNEELDYIKGKRCRKAAQKCRDGLLRKIGNKEL